MKFQRTKQICVRISKFLYYFVSKETDRNNRSQNYFHPLSQVFSPEKYWILDYYSMNYYGPLSALYGLEAKNSFYIFK